MKIIKEINGEAVMSATKVTQALDISARTLDNWYKYYHSDIEKPDDMPTLPEYYQSRYKGPRYWKVSDISALQAFKDWIPRGRGGVMGRINERYWSNRYRNKNDIVTDTQSETIQDNTITD